MIHRFVLTSIPFLLLHLHVEGRSDDDVNTLVQVTGAYDALVTDEDEAQVLLASSSEVEDVQTMMEFSEDDVPAAGEDPQSCHEAEVKNKVELLLQQASPQQIHLLLNYGRKLAASGNSSNVTTAMMLEVERDWKQWTEVEGKTEGEALELLEMKWGWVSAIVNVVTAPFVAVVNVVRNVAKEAADLAVNVATDIMDATASAVRDVHNLIVEGFHTIGKFLKETFEAAWKMMENMFDCLMDVLDDFLGDCARSLASQISDCTRGQGCEFSIGMPTCSHLSTKPILTKSFIQQASHVIKPDEGEPHALTFHSKDPETAAAEEANDNIFSEHLFQDNVSSFMDHLEQAMLHDEKELGLRGDPELVDFELPDGVEDGDPGHEEEDPDVLPKDHTTTLIQDATEENAHLVINYSRNAAASQAISYDGSASASLGTLVTCNTDTGVTNVKVKVDVHAGLSLTGSNSRSARTHVIPKKRLTIPKRVFKKVIMAGKVPVIVEVYIGLIHRAYRYMAGSLSYELALHQHVELNMDVNFNFKDLSRFPDARWTATYWRPSPTRDFTGAGQISMWYKIAPEVTVKVNGLPWKLDWGPKWIAAVDVRQRGTSCTKVEFSLETTLHGEYDVSSPSVPLGSVAGDACDDFTDMVASNPAAKGAACVTKAAFNFDPIDAARGACASMRDAVPDIKGKRLWHWNMGSDRLAYHNLGGQDVCKASATCKRIRMVNKAWGAENSWSVGTCSGRGYRSHRTADEGDCCLKGSKTLNCYDSYGDGWHGGYLEIAGARYCDGFSRWRHKTVTVVF